MPSSSIVRSGPTNSSSAAPISSSSDREDQFWIRRPTASSNRAACAARLSWARQQRLYFCPLPHGQALFREADDPIRAHARDRLGRLRLPEQRGLFVKAPSIKPNWTTSTASDPRISTPPPSQPPPQPACSSF